MNEYEKEHKQDMAHPVPDDGGETLSQPLPANDPASDTASDEAAITADEATEKPASYTATDGNDTENDAPIEACPEVESHLSKAAMPLSGDADRTEDAVPSAPTQPSAKSSRLWIAIVALVSALALVIGILIGGVAVYRMSETYTAQAVGRARESVVVIEVETLLGNGIGSGIIMTSDGYIATNHHVIENAVSITVYFTDGSQAVARVVGSSAMDDLAVIKVERQGLPTATFSNRDCYVGQRIYAIGHPGSAQLSWTTTAGIVSFVDRAMDFYDDDNTLEKKMILLQVDAAVNPGNSGGPIVNERGEVVGIVSIRVQEMQDTSSSGATGDGSYYTGLGFALPIKGASEILEAIIRDGNADGVTSSISFKRPMVGINCFYVKKDIRYSVDENGLVNVGEGEIMPVSGIYVSSISEGSAAEGKLMVGDILTEMKGYQLTDDQRFVSVINSCYPGDKVTVTVYRDGAYHKVTLTLGQAD